MDQEELLANIEQAAVGRLAELSLRQRELAELPSEIRRLTNLEKLDLDSNRLAALPPDIGRLKSLERLGLSRNELAALPDELWELTNLKELHLSANQLEVLPPDIGRLKNLERLHLDGNELAALPDELWELTNLIELYLSANQLAALPPDISFLENLERLDLDGNQLAVLPDELWELTNLKELHLSANLLATLPPDISRLKNLERLHLDGNKLVALPDELWELNNLLVLNLSSTRLSVPDELWQLTNLKELYFSGNELAALPSDISCLKNLERLDLNGNQLISLPDELWQLTKLQLLHLSDNQLVALPPDIGRLRNLEWLGLSRNRLTMLPDELWELTNLRILYVGGNELAVLPSDIGRLTSLTELYLDGNELAALPDELWELTSLTELYLDGNQLTALPLDIGRLSNLRILHLGDNELAVLPSDIGRLSSLLLLNLSGNELSTVPNEMWELTKLNILSLSGNELAALPPDIGLLTNLWYLNVSGNQLAALPPNIGRLISLSVLNFSCNELTELPDELWELSSLQVLYLANNQLAMLPAAIGRLTSLRQLDLDNNQLEDLPSELGSLDTLRNLTLEGNRRLRLPPLEIAKLGTQAVKRYLRALRTGSEAVWTSKLLIVGEGGVGKTCLYNALNGRLATEDYEDATVGIDIGPLALSHPHEPDVTMILSCWDFAGQEFNHAVHQFFFSNRALFLLVWNARHGWQQGKLYRWLENIKVRAPQAKVLLVATHIDQPHAAYPKAELQRKYEQIAGVYEVSNVTGDGIDELREAVRAHAADLPLMGLRWPSTWVQAAGAVSELRESGVPHTTRRDVRERMIQVGLEKEDATVLMRWLDELGEILHFEDEAMLRDLVVIEPEWVTGHVARVLRSDTVMTNDGILTRGHLERDLWPNLDGHVREHLLRLMEEFDLAYLIPDDPEDRSLIVERTPLDPPDYHDAWEAFRSVGQELRLRYRLDSMHPGIPTWLIARCHRFSMGLHWLDGVLFEDEVARHRALVVADDRRNIVDIFVRGPFPQRFMSLLRDAFRDTLRRYEGLTVQRYVPCPGYDELEDASCTHEFDLDNLERWVEKRPGRDEVDCPRCGERHSRLALVEGVGAPALTQDYTERRVIPVIERESAAIRDHVTQEATTTRAQLGQQIEGMIAYTKRNFLLQWQREQRESLVSCPNLFTIRPLGKSGILTAERYILQLYCQHDRGWHSVAPEGRYEFKQPREWWEKALPYLRSMTKVMRIVVPMGAAALDVAGDAATWAEEQHDVFENEFKLFDQMLKGADELLPQEDEVEALAEGLEERDIFGKHTGADLVPIRDLMDTLAEQDVDKGRSRWGGLTRVTKPEGEIVWLCEEHLAEFESRWDLWGEPVG